MFVITSFKMQENNFESIINTWRRLSGEQVESAALVSMSGDSQGHSFSKKKEDDTDPLVPDKKLSLGPAAVATASAAVSTTDLPRESSESVKPEEKQEFIEHDKEDKDAHGDFNGHDKNDNDYLENKSGLEEKYPESKWEKDKMGDNVDSVYLRPPPPHKVRSTTSTAEEEDCGIKCLYYTLQCCDCVLM